MNIQIGVYEAKTKLPELLRQVASGKRFTITNRGRAVADLVPSTGERPRDAGAAIDAFLDFKKRNPVGAEANIKELIEDGRE